MLVQIKHLVKKGAALTKIAELYKKKLLDMTGLESALTEYYEVKKSVTTKAEQWHVHGANACIMSVHMSVHMPIHTSTLISVHISMHMPIHMSVLTGLYIPMSVHTASHTVHATRLGLEDKQAEEAGALSRVLQHAKGKGKAALDKKFEDIVNQAEQDVANKVKATAMDVAGVRF